MTQLPDERAAEMRELFFETAQELLQSLNDEALKLEKHPADEELVRSIRRIVHTSERRRRGLRISRTEQRGPRIGRRPGAGIGGLPRQPGGNRFYCCRHLQCDADRLSPQRQDAVFRASGEDGSRADPATQREKGCEEKGQQ